jgi:hypothetical protein
VSSGSETKIVPESDVQYTRPPYYLQGSSALKKAQQTVPTAGGGSDPKDPPETKPKQPFGTDVDWTDPKAYADSLLEGPDGLPKSVQMLSALAGPLGMVAVGGANAAMTLGKISDLRATQIIAQAQGDTATSEYIEKELGKFIKRSPNIVSFLEEAIAPGTNKALEVITRMGLEYEQDKETGKITFTERMLERNKKRIQFSEGTRRETAKITSGPGGSSSGGPGVTVTPNEGGGNTYTFDDSGLTPEQIAEEEKITDDVFADIDAQFEAAGVAQVGDNKGGLMTKAKKKK